MTCSPNTLPCPMKFQDHLQIFSCVYCYIYSVYSVEGITMKSLVFLTDADLGNWGSTWDKGSSYSSGYVGNGPFLRRHRLRHHKTLRTTLMFLLRLLLKPLKCKHQALPFKRKEPLAVFTCSRYV